MTRAQYLNTLPCYWFDKALFFELYVNQHCLTDATTCAESIHHAYHALGAVLLVCDQTRMQMTRVTDWLQATCT